MPADARIRLTLDTSGAKSDLAALYGDMRRAPAVRVPGAASGSGGFVAGGGMGGVGMGGFDIGSLLRQITAAIAAQQMVGAIGPAALGMGRDALRESLLGGAFGSARGALASRDTVASRFGLAYQLGVVGDDMLKQMYDVEQQFGAGAAAKGTARARAALSSTVLSDVGSEALEIGLKALVPVIGDLAEAAKALKQAVGGGP